MGVGTRPHELQVAEVLSLEQGINRLFVTQLFSCCEMDSKS